MKDVKDLKLSIRFQPKTKLSLTGQRKFWQRILTAEFRESIGRVDVHHVVQESHIQYRTKEKIDITIYKDAETVLDDEEFSLARLSEIQRMVNALLKGIGGAAEKKIAFSTSCLFHLDLASKSKQRFLRENARFSPTARFRRTFRNYRGFRGFMLELPDNVAFVASLPGHIDFIYTGSSHTGSRQKFLNTFVPSCFRYISGMQ